MFRKSTLIGKRSERSYPKRWIEVTPLKHPKKNLGGRLF